MAPDETMPQYEVSIARYGTRVGRRSEVYLNHALYHEPDDDIRMDYFVWLVRGEGVEIVVDTGYSVAGGESRGRTLLMDPPELFASLGVHPENAPLVLITHAHYDHIGNLAHFRESPVVIARRELEFWSSRHAQRVQFHHSVEDVELAELFAAVDAGRVTAFDERIEIAPGIEMIEIGGHTPGQSVVRVPTAAGVVLLASDAIHYYEEFEKDMPFSSVAELVAMYAGFDRIRGMLETGEVEHLVAGHDPATLDRFRAIGRSDSELVVTIGEPAMVNR
ncbi:N-acyl homoserine lactonase family protein [Herbiconiux ginsengi]|uniref:Glyoxylase, beta-lactamase superfamily II n=1 Tax=Herbiconiux ginsengi TaxID=381665 RepID=A0A1H3TQ68_9MICO|nr:N-acyl homoserine lactonase family protein [Herbiconiux ginsengi]SDZ52422.1 Glyoxylase, beta-lactamase superfamily II [Herbiconiux ginsengi]